jgi:methionyl-tRNA formyltransferase
MNSLHQLYQKAVHQGSQLIIDTLQAIANKQVHPEPQDPAARSYFSRPGKKNREAFFKQGFKFFRFKDLFS